MLGGPSCFPGQYVLDPCATERTASPNGASWLAHEATSPIAIEKLDGPGMTGTRRLAAASLSAGAAEAVSGPRAATEERAPDGRVETPRSVRAPVPGAETPRAAMTVLVVVLRVATTVEAGTPLDVRRAGAAGARVAKGASVATASGGATAVTATAAARTGATAPAGRTVVPTGGAVTRAVGGRPATATSAATGGREGARTDGRTDAPVAAAMAGLTLATAALGALVVLVVTTTARAPVARGAAPRIGCAATTVATSAPTVRVGGIAVPPRRRPLARRFRTRSNTASWTARCEHACGP